MINRASTKIENGRAEQRRLQAELGRAYMKTLWRRWPKSWGFSRQKLEDAFTQMQREMAASRFGNEQAPSRPIGEPTTGVLSQGSMSLPPVSLLIY